MRKALLIYNPLSGNRNVPRRMDYIVGRFMDNGILVVPYRIGNEGGIELLDVIREGGYSFIVISGGDGTVNSIINLIYKSGLNIPVGLIPAGTCNDFARSLNIPMDLKACLDIILEENISEIDAGLINNDFYFLNTCAGGNFVDVSYNTNSEFKKNFGSLAYYIRALGEMANIRSEKLKITTDNEVLEGEFLLFLILNGRHAAGFYNVIKEADLSDGYMDILLLHSCPPIEMAGLFFKVINNDFMSDRNVTWLRTRECKIEGDSDFILSVDGEKWDKLPITVSFINRLLKVYTRK
jgi:lipid kinase, YegS/Rv2252/BmrU family